MVAGALRTHSLQQMRFAGTGRSTQPDQAGLVAPSAPDEVGEDDADDEGGFHALPETRQETAGERPEIHG